ncbi:AtzH-like domain-containing protein [Subtercola sp. YIM 133946]|uniref:AtzH-like domain-containing protein n=1 Tax=Subtercola sp. YIM 133946 TaxID=3118909 RepID=UPI002F93ECE6
MRWRPPTPGRPIEPGPPLVPRTTPPASPPAPPSAPSPSPDAAPTPEPAPADAALTPEPAPADAAPTPEPAPADAAPTPEPTPRDPAPNPTPATPDAALSDTAPNPPSPQPPQPAHLADPESSPMSDHPSAPSAATPPPFAAPDPTADAETTVPAAAESLPVAIAAGRASDTPTWLGDPTLLAAFWRYERALMTNDIAELDVLFAQSRLTVRSEAGSALVGHDEIAAFRAGRPPVPQRYLRRMHLRPIDENTAVIVAETVRNDNGTGSQTQLWQRPNPAAPWAVTVAHVSTVPGVQFGTRELSRADERAIWATPAERRPLIASAAHPNNAAEVGPLAGVRVAVKDLFAITGEIIGAGTPAFAAGRRPETETAPAVQALIDAGAEITGLAQTDELAFSIAGTNVHYGTPPNPAAPGHISGGSTSGPASAVAMGLADLGLGTDTAGSIRVPGSYTGLFGLRTTHNAVSRAQLIGLAPSFDTVGLLARDLVTLERGVAALLATGDRMPGAPFPPATPAQTSVGAHGAAATGAQPAGDGSVASSSVSPVGGSTTDTALTTDTAPTTDTTPTTPTPTGTAAPTPITRILIDPALVALADPATRLTFEAALRALALNAGLPVQTAEPSTALDPGDLERWFDAFRLVQQFEAWAGDADFVTANPTALDPAIAARFAAASTITEQAAADARSILARATSVLESVVAPGTALALPSTSSAAPSLSADPAEIDRVRAATLRLTCLASLSGLPALTLPYGRVGTLPTGLCLIGSRGADLALLAVANARS